MKGKNRKVTRIINARQVSFEGTKMWLSPIGFDADSGCIYGGATLVEIKSDGPKFWSSADSGACLFEKNYFLGEPQVCWQSKVSYRKRKGEYSFFPNFDLRIRDQRDEGFFVYLPDEYGEEDFYQNAVENKEKIREWISRWYAYEMEGYCSMYNIGEATREKAMELGKELDRLHDELIEIGVAKEDGTIVNPQCMFVIPVKKVKQACYNRSSPNSRYIGGYLKTVRKRNVQWITPNVCLADNEEDFFELMKECYGITEICE